MGEKREEEGKGWRKGVEVERGEGVEERGGGWREGLTNAEMVNRVDRAPPSTESVQQKICHPLTTEGLRGGGWGGGKAGRGGHWARGVEPLLLSHHKPAVGYMNF